MAKVKKINSIDKLYEIKQQIKELQIQEKELVDKIKSKMQAKGKFTVYGSLAAAILSEQEKYVIDNERCYKIIGPETFVKVASVTKTALNKAKVKDVSGFTTIDKTYRLTVKEK